MPTPTKPPRKHPNTKRTGELAEAAFVVKAASLGFAVSKPWGDSERYDFILDAGHRTWRVQIKCTESTNAGGYQVQSTYTDRKRKGHYTADDIDVLVAYILPLDLWYVVPAHALPASASLRFYPGGNCTRPRFEQYREAWDLFRHKQPPKATRRQQPEIAEPENTEAEAVLDPAPDPHPPESPLERTMNQWADRVHKLYLGRKR
ncbi:MAG TPA: group I intron-associated PD-(D/E)XK endonuclease [Terriglobales bacterium]|nr:group I intron-associated PD-(D/E)XK endonuclease [Terriglobales bacterium]